MPMAWVIVLALSSLAEYRICKFEGFEGFEEFDCLKGLKSLIV